MKAWLLDKIGDGVKSMRLAEVADPKPGPGEVVLDLELAALNPADRYLAQGAYPAHPPTPHILGRDGIGTVRSVGPDVKQFHIGQRLLILRGETGVTRHGAFAQQVAVSEQSVVEPPTDWSIPQAAAAPLVYLTAIQALTQWDDLPSPAIVLITGASGGVGVASIQLAKAMGHRIVALSRSETKRQTLLDMGVSTALDPTDPRWAEKLKTDLGQQRVNLAVDNIGGELFPKVIDTLGNHGRVSVVGQLAGPVPHFSTATLFFRRLRIGGVAVGVYTRPEAHAAWAKVVKLLNASNQRPLVDQIFPFAQLPAAFDKLASGPMGKILLDIKSA